MNRLRNLIIISLCLYELEEVHAALEADFLTDRGTITVVLEYEKSPLAVANLITLSNGTRSWREARSGAVCSDAFFSNLNFDEVVNTNDVKLAAVGATDVGFFFPDEITSNLRHEPYILGMSNDGPNTNGGRIYFTGNGTMPDRDGFHTVFGKILDPPSRLVLDNILGEGPGATEFISVTIRRTDPYAVAYDELAEPLPIVSPVAGVLNVTLDGPVNLEIRQPALSEMRAKKSSDLVTWKPNLANYSGFDEALPQSFQTIDQAILPKSFYNISLVQYNNILRVLGASSFANRTLEVDTEGSGMLIYFFDETGLAGTYQNILVPGELPFFEGTFQIRDEVIPFFGPYSFKILLQSEGLGGAPLNLIRGGYDSATQSSVNGRAKISFLNQMMDTVFEDGGTLMLDLP